MNWLHCFWGIGATSGPVIMAVWLAKEGGWRMGYRTIGLLQTALVLVLVLTLPLWKKASGAQLKAEAAVKSLPLRQVCGFRREAGTVGILFATAAWRPRPIFWASSFAVSVYGVNADTGAALSSLFFSWDHSGKACFRLCLNPIKTGTLIRTGEACVLCGVLLLLLPLPHGSCFWHLPCGHWLCAHIPSMLHRTPEVFGKDLSQAMMGFRWRRPIWVPLLCRRCLELRQELLASFFLSSLPAAAGFAAGLLHRAHYPPKCKHFCLRKEAARVPLLFWEVSQRAESE